MRTLKGKSMSRTNKHRSNHLNSLSVNYMLDELGPRKSCPRRGCKGQCIQVLVRYKPYGPINYEHECVVCGKVIKDPRYLQVKKNKPYNKQWRKK
jgi:DNA-directed RNA polymerase subunit N (RpoN/RPB10)